MLKESEFQITDNTKIIKHRHKREFTIIANDCINDKNLSGDALAILVYVMSKPSDWEIRIRDLSERFSIGRDKTYSVINRLAELGYLKRRYHRNSDGSFSGMDIYAADTPMFLTEQPLPENQEVVTEEKTDKQPLPGLPFTENQEAAPYITNKDLNKENNNNKILSIPNRAREDSSVNYLTSSNDSMVSIFMKKIEGLSISEATLKGWVSKYGSDYVAEKIRILESKGKIANPSGCLIAAIAYDWKEKVEQPSRTDQISPPLNELPKTIPTHDENKKWFLSLANCDKEQVFELGVRKQPIIETYLQDKKLSILDTDFADSFIFKMLMQIIGRAL